MSDKIPGWNPPEPVERRPEPTPAPPLPCGMNDATDEQAKLKRRVVVLETALGATAIRGGELLAENNALHQDVASVLVAMSGIEFDLKRIPCMSEDCDGPECHVSDARDGLPNTRCHRCAAVRLARSVLNGH